MPTDHVNNKNGHKNREFTKCCGNFLYVTFQFPHEYMWVYLLSGVAQKWAAGWKLASHFMPFFHLPPLEKEKK